MTQHSLNRLVAEATGESRRTVASLGFTLANPVVVEHDPEPYDELASYVTLTWQVRICAKGRRPSRLRWHCPKAGFTISL